jgi:predicted house-cleaning noncanonical NTP pyrophosphatase (MazG superfamily)
VINLNGKLVRDKIPEIIEASGKKPIIKILPDDEFLLELDKKFIEELNEFKAASAYESRSRILEELADLLEVLLAYCDLYNFSAENLYKTCEEKRIKRGGFTNKIYWSGNEE